MADHTTRPYLVIPKLIEQPTWGGTYIVETKKWHERPELNGKKIGQSYELYDKSNLSLIDDSRNPEFAGEIADPKLVEQQSAVPNSVSLSQLISEDPVHVLGQRIVDVYGAKMHLLLKFTQALGNSFQLHIADSKHHPRWKTKPESWYYFEPGLITCGVRKDASWQDYQHAVTELDNEITRIAARVKDGSLIYAGTVASIDALIKRYNPWKYVNLVRIEKGTLLDLSHCGIHHSWEEDLASIPLGNVLYEIQLNVMDDVATIRSFDKGKMSKDGKLRPLQIEDYFALADRSTAANDPKTHMRTATVIQHTPEFAHERILETKYYSMDRVTLATQGSEFVSTIDTFRHLFVRSGTIEVMAGNLLISASTGHSVFVPGGSKEYAIRGRSTNSEVLISY